MEGKGAGREREGPRPGAPTPISVSRLALRVTPKRSAPPHPSCKPVGQVPVTIRQRRKAGSEKSSSHGK